MTMKKIGKFLFKHKILIMLLTLAAIGGSFFYRWYERKQQITQVMQKAVVETAEIEARDLLNYISATGTVESVTVKEVSASLTNCEITSLPVQEGDVIQKGDVIATLDTSDIQLDIAEVKENIAKNEELDSLSRVTAERELTYSRTSLTDDIASADKTIADAAEALAEACDNYGDAKSTLSAAKETRDNKQNDYNAIKDEYNTLLTKYQSEQAGVIAAASSIDASLSDNELQSSESDIITIAATTVTSSQVETAKTKMQEAQTALSAAETAVTSADNKVSSAYTQEQSAQKTYEDAISSRDKTVKSAANSAASQEESYEKTVINLGSETDSLSKQLKEYEKQLAKGTITAPVSGTVTSVAVEAGDTYGGGELITIQNVDNFIISAEIDEYDISDITIGMRVVIKTDATREEELEGYVSYISPISSQTASTTSTDVTYRIEVSLEDMTELNRLRIGMSAKLNIVIEEKENVLTVPYDAIETNDAGESIIKIIENKAPVSGNATSNNSVSGNHPQGEAQQAASLTTVEKEIKVGTGMEDDYYIEIISEEIEEGMQVIIPSGTASDSIDSGMPAGALMGGGMPSGGGMGGGRMGGF